MGTNNQTASTFAEAEQPSERDEDQVIISEEDLATANCDEEIGGWILNTLQKIQPGTEITAGSMRALSQILDAVTTTVLDEASKMSHDECHTFSSDLDNAEGEKQGQLRPPRKRAPLTSLDISKALKKILPGAPGGLFRPYLPTVTKQAWHLDKQSLKGIKKQKTAQQKTNDVQVSNENEINSVLPPKIQETSGSQLSGCKSKPHICNEACR